MSGLDEQYVEVGICPECKQDVLTWNFRNSRDVDIGFFNTGWDGKHRKIEMKFGNLYLDLKSLDFVKIIGCYRCYYQFKKQGKHLAFFNSVIRLASKVERRR